MVLVEDDDFAEGAYCPDPDPPAALSNVSNTKLHASCALVEDLGLRGEHETLETNRFLVVLGKVLPCFGMDLHGEVTKRQTNNLRRDLQS